VRTGDSRNLAGFDRSGTAENRSLGALGLALVSRAQLRWQPSGGAHVLGEPVGAEPTRRPGVATTWCANEAGTLENVKGTLPVAIRSDDAGRVVVGAHSRKKQFHQRSGDPLVANANARTRTVPELFGRHSPLICPGPEECVKEDSGLGLVAGA